MGFLRTRKFVFLDRFKGICMKPILGWTLAAMAAMLAAMPSAASAQHGGNGWHGDIRVFETHDARHWRSGAWRHGWHGGRNGWWWVAGSAWYFYPQPVYPYPDPYRPPTIVVEQAPAPIVVQVPPPAPIQVQPAQPSAPPTQQFWYYCDAARGYYPYVASCPGGWKTVPATPTGVSQ
jgi:hypothetical protein